MSVNPIEGVKNVVEVKRVAPVEKTNVRNVTNETQADEKSFSQSKEEAGKQFFGGNPSEMLKDQIQEINHKLKMENRRCEFRFVEEANRVAIKVVDNDTDEVIREIPSEETLKTLQALREMTGIVVDEMR